MEAFSAQNSAVSLDALMRVDVNGEVADLATLAWKFCKGAGEKVQVRLVMDREANSQMCDDPAFRKMKEQMLGMLEAKQQKEKAELKRLYPRPAHLGGKYEQTINLAVVGGSGQGKSSLICSLLDLQPSDPAAPKTGAGAETTKVPTPYEAGSAWPNVVVWDCPGSGTPTFPSETYLRDMGLKYFSLVRRVESETASTCHSAPQWQLT